MFWMKILGIETSCDETAAAVIEDGNSLLSNEILSSMDLHAQYGGVIPEIAARSHIEAIMPVIDNALKNAHLTMSDINAIAVTQGAGLSGSLLIGVLTAATLAIDFSKPLFPVNHVIGHVYANFLTDSHLENYVMPDQQPTFPMLAVIVSGGHSQLALFSSHLDYKLLGVTRDDAVGEAFDKVAKIIGLPYPGGPSVSKLACQGNPEKYKFPEAKLDSDYDFSFSGPKTAVLRLAQAEIGEDFNFPSFRIADRLKMTQKADIAASFQSSVVSTIASKVKKAITEFNPKTVVIAGGVAANTALRNAIGQLITDQIFIVPDLKLCTDNAAMIATRGYYQIVNGISPINPFEIDVMPNLKM